MNSLAPRDATMYWLSARTRNDLFLLYCFADSGQSDALLRRTIANRVAGIPDLLVHVLATPANIAYPFWAPCEFIDDQFTVHPLPIPTWSNLQAALGELLATGLRADRRAWHLHVFREVDDAPGFASGESALVAVLQLSHALADGRRAAEIARALFAEAPVAPESAVAERHKSVLSQPMSAAAGLLRRIVPEWVVPGETITACAAAVEALPELPIGMARTVIRGFAAEGARRKLAALTSSGIVPQSAPVVPPNLLNGGGANPAAHTVRMLVRDANSLRVPGHTVTVVALTAVSLALQRYLAYRGEPTTPLRAQVPMAVTPNDTDRNSYRDLSVDLATTEPVLRRRAARIAADLTTLRQRAEHPLQEAQSHATAAIPAPILHRNVTGYPIDVLPEQVSGHTVMSSVHRGPADLTFAGSPVRFTAGFPALGAVMHLTHGIHGLGNTVTFSIHADPDVIPDLDAYAARLDAAITEVTEALRPADLEASPQPG
ncbi:WS/DGAT domain-containing protein [Nocardia sp. NPDC051030]|uniref:WS/DGAT domain-containing protein n=1 Tax=Nocardia sp. NPDC051030 TaxID=3155162 RepID=UPI0034121CD7